VTVSRAIIWAMSSPMLKFMNSPPDDVPELKCNVRFPLNHIKVQFSLMLLIFNKNTNTKLLIFEWFQGPHRKDFISI
jgi:hypothetical protein